MNTYSVIKNAFVIIFFQTLCELYNSYVSVFPYFKKNIIIIAFYRISSTIIFHKRNGSGKKIVVVCKRNT